MKYKVTHVTTYDYDDLAPICHNLVRLTPRRTATQSFNFHWLVVKPHPTFNDKRVDSFGNQVTHFAIEEGHRRLSVTATSRVEVQPRDLPPPEETAPWETIVQRLDRECSPEALEAIQQRLDSPLVRRAANLAAYTRPSFPPGAPILVGLLDLTRRIHEDFEFDASATTVHTTLEEVFAMRRGVCQDLTHVQLGCLRSIGLAARYVSGYLRTHPPAGKPRLIGADQSHAWVSVWCGEQGWIDADPTNNSLPQDEHITLAYGRDYSDVCPIEGVFIGGGAHRIGVSVDVAPQED